MEIEKSKEGNKQSVNTIYHKKNIENWHSIQGFASLPSYILDWVESRTSEVFTIWDMEGKAIFVSEQVKNIFGYDKSEVLGSYWYHFVSPKEAGIIKENVQIKTDETQKFNTYVLNKEHKFVWTECTVKPFQCDQHRLIISALKDITEKKEAEELMIRSEKMSVAGQLAAAVAHEIRNPLTSLKGFLQLLQAGVNRKEEYYKIMIDEIEKIENITSELLSISKPNTENRKKEPLAEMIKEVAFLLEPQANANNVTIHMEEPIDEYIICDRSQMKQVLINIIKNAIEAMENSGKITVFTEYSQSALIVNIQDEGPGIPDEIIGRLGEPFLTTKKNGTGLGLMITKQLLERHGASLHIKNNPDKGCTFQLIFPKKFLADASVDNA